jgi:hypothetical protein
MRATYSPSTWGMHYMSPRHGLRPFSASLRRTISCEALVLGELDHSVGQQLQRPAGAACGGLAQAVATSKASSLPVSLRSAPGRGSSLSARSRLPSTKRRWSGTRWNRRPPRCGQSPHRYCLRPPPAISELTSAYGRRAYPRSAGH